MPSLDYECEMAGLLPRAIGKGFTKLSWMRVNRNNPLDAVYLSHADGTGLKIVSQMHEVAERLEVGVLTISQFRAEIQSNGSIDLPASFRTGLTATKMIISEAGYEAASGLVLVAPDHNRPVIVAAAFPCCLSVFAPFISESFTPEYELEDYRSAPIDSS